MSWTGSGGCRVVLAWACWAGAALHAPVPVHAGPQPAELGGAAGVLGPVAVARPARGPVVVVREQPESRLVALRLAVRVSEPAGLEGVTRVLLELVQPELEAAAAGVGGRVSLERTATHAVYRVVGPADEFQRLAALVLRAVTVPAGASPGAVAAAVQRARSRAAADLDTPEPLVRAMLREALFPGLAEAPGPGRGLDGLTPDRLAGWWAGQAGPDRVAVVVVGGVEAARAAAAFEDWPVRGERTGRVAPDGRGGGPPSPPPAQIVARRVGLGYPASQVDPAALAVAAALLEWRLALSGDRRTSVEVWWSGGRRALVLVGTEEPVGGAAERRAPGARERLERVLADLAARPDASEVVRARRRLVRDILFAARSAEGLAEVLGGMLDRTGEPEAALLFAAALERVGPGAVAAALRRLRDTRPEVVELAP